jgi:thioredoxin-like negative regulator of GroEL
MTPFAAAVALAAAAAIPWTDDIDGAFRAAAERHVPVMVDVWAVWCVPCKKMDDETYRDPGIVEAAARVVAVKVDADAQPIFIERYAVEAYPEVLFLDEGGREIGRLTGFQSAEQFLPVLRRAAEGYPLYRAWLEGDADPAAHLGAGEYLAAMGSRRLAAKALAEPARRAGKDPASMEESMRLRLGLALVAAGEAKDAAPILQQVSETGSTREVQLEALRALAGLDGSRATRDAAQAAAERLEREFSGR